MEQLIEEEICVLIELDILVHLEEVVLSPFEKLETLFLLWLDLAHRKSVGQQSLVLDD